jgi:hypothetical protein
VKNAMITCRFTSNIGNVEFDSIGKKAKLSEQRFTDAVEGGMALIPEAYFNEIGFTADELAAQGPVGQRFEPSDAFCKKLAKAQQVFQDIQRRMLEGGRQEVLAEIAASQGE